MTLEEARQMLRCAIQIQRDLVMEHSKATQEELEAATKAMEWFAESRDPSARLLASLAKSGFAALAVQQVFECVRSFNTAGTQS